MNSNKSLRTLIYIYLFTILLDAIFRKWVFPSYSAPIMMIKEVVAIIIFFAGSKFWNTFTFWEKGFLIVGFIAFLTTLLWGHQNLLIATYGCLPFFFGVTVSFIIYRALEYEDLMKIGKILVYISIVNSILIIIQFNLPVMHVLNYTGGSVEENVAEKTASELAGVFRPSGIFMHPAHNGPFIFISYLFTLYFLFINNKVVNRVVLIAAFILTSIAVFCSCSRSTVFYFIGGSVYFLIFCIRSRIWNKKVFITLVCLIPIVFLFFTSSLGKQAVENMNERFEIASETQYLGQSTTQGTLSDIAYRMVIYHVNAIIDPHTLDGDEVPFWGYGQGLSTQVGGRIADVQKHAGFMLAEFDGLRIICESGQILGIFIIFFRIGYPIRFLGYVIGSVGRHRYLSLITYPSFFLFFWLTSNWGNITVANFAFFIAGLFMVCKKVESRKHGN